MTCERCRELMTELVCGELDRATAETARAHAADCATCSRELHAFERVLNVAEDLPLETPSATVEQRIMQAAREALSGGATQPRTEAAEATPREGLRAWFERLATWAMSPQVAMASVLLLVVGIGLYALPFGHEGSAPESLHLAQEPSPAAATATSAPVSEAEKALPEAEDVVREEASARAEPRRHAAEGKATGSSARTVAEGKPKASRARPATSGGTSKEASGAASKRRLESSELLDSMADSEERASKGYAPPPPSAPASKSAPMAEPAPEPSNALQKSVSKPSATGAQGASVGAAPRAETAAASADDAKAMLAEGVRAAQSGDYARAVRVLEPLAQSSEPERATARVWVARSLRALDQCERALPYYATLVSAANASRALLNEAADCYERTGDRARAESLRARAEALNAAP